jgi:hypothetical protein
MKLVCEECGSDKIQTLQWVDVNTEEIRGAGPGEYEDNWCDECQDHTEFINEDEFLTKKEE